MAKPKEITLRWLKAKKACSSNIELFRETFGEQASLNRSNLVRAALAGLNTEWLAGVLLDPATWRAYEEATNAAAQAYDEANAQAWRVYKEAKDAASRAHVEAKVPAVQACVEAKAPAWQAYREATISVRRTYQEAKASALADLLGLD